MKEDLATYGYRRVWGVLRHQGVDGQRRRRYKNALCLTEMELLPIRCPTESLGVTGTTHQNASPLQPDVRQRSTFILRCAASRSFHYKKYLDARLTAIVKRFTHEIEKFNINLIYPQTHEYK